MIFLPIAWRELRVASRRTSLFRLRWWAVLLAIFVGLISLAVVALSRRGANLGNPLFNILTGYAFGLALLSAALTADSVSEERREGTLGLLFLTEMKGYDVVVGKFISGAIYASYALLALLPITALPVLLGGVTGAEFWRRALTLVDAMFVALAAGIFVSTFQRNSQRALVSTLGLMLLLVAGLPALAYMAKRNRLISWVAEAQWLSPLTAYSYAADILYARHPGVYWSAFLGSACVGVCFLFLASLCLPQLWQEGKANGPPRVFGKLWTWNKRERAQTLSIQQRELLSKNPVAWVLKMDSGAPWAAWAVVIAWGTTVAVMLFLNHPRSAALLLSHYGVTPFGFVFKIIFAFQACRFFSEGRRSGTLEPLLCTPLTDREIIGGQMSALWSSFLWPLVIFCSFLFAPFVVQLTTGVFTGDFRPMLTVLGQSFFAGFYSLRLILDLFAVSWFGMGMALSSKKPQLAPALTVLYVLLLPSVISFCALDIIADVFFIFWGIAHSRRNLRQMVSQHYLVLSTA